MGGRFGVGGFIRPCSVFGLRADTGVRVSPRRDRVSPRRASVAAAAAVTCAALCDGLSSDDAVAAVVVTAEGMAVPGCAGGLVSDEPDETGRSAVPSAAPAEGAVVEDRAPLEDWVPLDDRALLEDSSFRVTMRVIVNSDLISLGDKVREFGFWFKRFA